MTEVPEHLLARSRERRAALGLGGGAPAGPSGDAAAPSASAATPATVARPAAPAPVAAAPAVIEEAKPVPAYMTPAAARARIPVWIIPVLAFLPFWGILYIGAFGSRHHAEALTGAELGAEIYRAQGCAACHGAAGEGGVGPALADGEAAKTFPAEEDHAAWIRSGSTGVRGQPYGDPDREGGQRVATGGMPAFGSLSDEEVAAVVLYEREEL